MAKTPERVTELLKKEVEKKGQRKVSRETGIALLSVQRYLKGESEPTQTSLQKLADYFQETFIIEVTPRKASAGEPER